MKRKVQLGPLLRLAADEYLWNGRPTDGREPFSCIAVGEAILREGPGGSVYAAMSFLRSLGVDSSSATQFSEFRDMRERQAARHAWLHFAADIADEWDVRVWWRSPLEQP